MGEIVAAFAAAHAPQLITRPPDEKPEQLDASIAAMAELGRILDETKPDVILFFGSDHMESFSLTCYPTFAIVAGSNASAKFGGKEFNHPIHREMAEDILNIPIFTNVYLPPLPTPKRCAELGAAIADIIKGRPEKVAILASGGMSHYPGTWKYPTPEFDFDYWMISELEAGRTESLLNLTSSQLDEAGNTELLIWINMLGAVGKLPGELVQYTPTW